MVVKGSRWWFKKIKPLMKRGLPGLSTNYGGFDIAILIHES
jgi:hypothetical protein